MASNFHNKNIAKSKFALTNNAYIEILCQNENFNVDLNSLMESKAIGDCQTVLTQLVNCDSSLLFGSQYYINALLSIYSQFINSDVPDLIIDALKGLKKVIPYAGENFNVPSEREIILALVFDSAEADKKPSIRFEAMNCLIDICSHHSSTLHPYIQQLSDLITHGLIASEAIEDLVMTLKCYEIWLELCRVILKKLDSGIPYSQIKEIPMLDPVIREIIGVGVNCLTKTLKVSPHTTANIIKEHNDEKTYLATLIMCHLCKIYKWFVVSMLIPFIDQELQPNVNIDFKDHHYGFLFTIVFICLHVGELDLYLTQILTQVLPLALQSISLPKMTLCKDPASSLLCSTLLYYPHLMQTDILITKESGVKNDIESCMKFNSDLILKCITEGLTINGTTDKILSITLCYFLNNSSIYPEIFTMYFQRLSSRLFLALLKATVANNVLNIGTAIQNLLTNSSPKCLKYSKELLNKIIQLNLEFFQENSSNEKIVSLCCNSNKQSISCCMLASCCLIVNSCVEKYREQAQVSEIVGMLIAPLIQFCHKLVKLTTVITEYICMCLEETMLLLITVYSLEKNATKNLNENFNFLSDMFSFCCCHLNADSEYINLPCTVLQLTGILIEKSQEQAKPYLPKIKDNLKHILNSLLPNYRIIIAVNGLIQLWVTTAPSSFEAYIEHSVHMITQEFNRVKDNYLTIDYATGSELITTAFTSILNVFSSIIHALSGSPTIQIFFPYVELITKILIDIVRHPLFSSNNSEAIQICACVLIGHLGCMGPRIQHSLQKEDIFDFLDDCNDSNSPDVNKAYFYAEQATNEQFHVKKESLQSNSVRI